MKVSKKSMHELSKRRIIYIKNYKQWIVSGRDQKGTEYQTKLSMTKNNSI